RTRRSTACSSVRSRSNHYFARPQNAAHCAAFCFVRLAPGMTLRSATILLATLAAPAGAATAAAAIPALGGAALDAGARILVVAPHPDDESLCCGGLIATARRAGAEVSIVWITSGGGF